jgi:hypothetical protein
MQAIGPTNVRHALPFAIENTMFRKSTISGIRPARCIFDCERMMEIIIFCDMMRDKVVGPWTGTGKPGVNNTAALF